jgi:hypothetical protein
MIRLALTVLLAACGSTAPDTHVTVDGGSEAAPDVYDSSDASEADATRDALDSGLTCPGLAAAWGWPAFACEEVINGLATGECFGQAWFPTSDCPACCRDWTDAATP